MENHLPLRSFDPDTLVDQYADHLFRYALAHVRDRALAEDLVQETFLAALQSSAGFGGQSSLRTWLCGILKHKIVDHFRKTWRQTQLNTNEAETNHPDAIHAAMAAAAKEPRWMAMPHTDPQTRIEQKAFWGVLAKGLAELSPRTATAFALREIEQLSSKDVCERLQISESNLWVMLHRARRHLRQCFEVNWLL